MIPAGLADWALRHRVSMAALRELSALAGAPLELMPAPEASSPEGYVQSQVRLEAPAAGYRLFRNNVGALKDDRGIPIRYGLANDSARLNEKLKSSDLVGWRRLVVTPGMVGQTVAQFVSRECKPTGWTFKGTTRETAQLAWINLVLAEGGDACFVTGPGTLSKGTD